MKAIVMNEFGGVEVLKLQEVERPVPAADEVLIRTYASGVNPADCVIRKGGNAVLRPLLKLPLIIGWDASGVVEEIGATVHAFHCCSKSGTQLRVECLNEITLKNVMAESEANLENAQVAILRLAKR